MTEESVAYRNIPGNYYDKYQTQTPISFGLEFVHRHHSGKRSDGAVGHCSENDDHL
jgi:hypothetical protein